MSERVWHKGPPPHIGWWLTRDNAPTSYNLWRYWNGQQWSVAIYEEDDGSDGGIPTSGFYGPIEWTDYWPENARVPRLDPTGGHWTFNVDGQEPKHLPRKIDLAMRNSDLFSSVGPGSWYWGLDGSPFDILAWRPAA